jgi:phenylacetate-CoA ligase
VDTNKLALRVGIFGAEPWTDAMRSELEQRLDIAAVDIYGLSEVMGPGVAQECVETKDGPTIWEDHFYPEVINPATGEVVADGEHGELVFTSLTKQAMPIIRYRTRDLTRLLPGSARTMRRMDKITGRSDDMLIIRGVNVFPSQIEEHLLAVDGLAPHYFIELSKDGHLDSIEINVEMTHSCDHDAEQAAASHLKQRVKSYVGISAAVRVHQPGGIPRSEGKAQRIVDKPD